EKFRICARSVMTPGYVRNRGNGQAPPAWSAAPQEAVCIGPASRHDRPKTTEFESDPSSRQTMKRFLSGTLVFGALILAEPVLAGPIDRACRQSARAAATSQLCGCLQSLADTTLKRSDHRRVA